ncbi:GAP family protein [Mycobacteroides chelonae]|uniref:GAP family protein n=1 Tax=Mycobacteroides chelonae TaxID=1774 RepID=UPI003AAD183D
MWGELLGLALIVSLNPMLLGLILVVISRPRPVQNLLAIWVGALIVNVPAFVIALFALHLVPSFADLAKNLTTAEPGSAVKPLQLGTGVLALGVAVWIGVRLRARKRAPQSVATGSTGDAAVLVLDEDQSSGGSVPAGRIRRVLTGMGASIRRIFGRGKNAWESGSPWVSLLLGIGYMPPPPLVLLVVTLVVGSGVAIGAQVTAVLVFIFVELLLFEIALLSYVVAPTKTEAALEPIHRWAESRRSEILLVIFAVLGLWQLLIGIGAV